MHMLIVLRGGVLCILLIVNPTPQADKPPTNRIWV